MHVISSQQVKKLNTYVSALGIQCVNLPTSLQIEQDEKLKKGHAFVYLLIN